jgi:hypothetical protein
MEKLMDFDEWAKNYKPQQPEYVAVFDPETGFVSSVGPAHAFESEQYKLPIDQEIAESIIEGKIKISSCVVDPRSSQFEIVEMKNIFKIDDVLHRIISKEWSDIEKPDLYLTYDSVSQTLTIELSEEFGGSKKLPEKFQPVKVRKTIWAGDTEMNFLITDYNDPNLLYEMISVKINELLGNSKVFENIKYENFSVYTRRLFKHCVIEYK